MTEEAFALLANYDLFPELYFSSHSIDNLNDGLVNRLEQMLGKHAFKSSLHAPFTNQDIGSADSNLQSRSYQRLRQTLELAAKLHSHPMVVHPGYGDMPDDAEFERWLQRATASLRALCQQACDLGVKIAFENIYDSTPDRLKQLLAVIESDCAGICFDTGHFNLFSPLPMQAWLDQLGKHILVCHVHDNDKSGDQHLAIGDGNLDYQPLINWYNRLNGNPKPVMTLEALNRTDVITSVTRINEWGI